jgi:hypothetical protein
MLTLSSLTERRTGLGLESIREVAADSRPGLYEGKEQAQEGGIWRRRNQPSEQVSTSRPGCEIKLRMDADLAPLQLLQVHIR